MNYMCHIWHDNLLEYLLTLHCVGGDCQSGDTCFKSFGFSHSSTLDMSVADLERSDQSPWCPWEQKAYYKVPSKVPP